MGFANGKLAKVHKIDNKGKWSLALISTSKKNKETNEYEVDFSNHVAMFGHAQEMVRDLKLKGGETIKLIQVESFNKYSKEQGKTYYNYTVWDFDLVSRGDGTQRKTETTQAPTTPSFSSKTQDEDELPF